MNIKPLKAFVDNYIWCIQEGQTIFCVDPGDAQPVLDFLAQQDLKLKGILITHHHMDHIGGVETLVNQFPDVQVIAPADSRISCVTRVVQDGEQALPFGFTVMEIPGHTSTHIAYYQAESQVLFCGDTLFSGGCGRVFDGTMAQLFASLEKLSHLPDETGVYCAHEYTQANLGFALHLEPDNLVASRYLDTLVRAAQTCSLPSTIGLEKQINPFFRLDVPSIVDYVEKKTHENPSRFEIFKQLREEKNAW